MKVIAYCFSCNKEYDVTNKAINEIILCDCGGYVISKTGKMQIKLVPENELDLLNWGNMEKLNEVE